MKYTKYFSILFIICVAGLIFSPYSTAQSDTTSKNDAKKTAIKNMIDSQHFVFVPQSVTPLRGGFRSLTSEYDVIVRKDTMVSYLPYFGRATTAPIDPSRSGLDFTSTDISYTATPRKKGGWNIVIKPKDKTDIQQYMFTIFDNGSASLVVSSASRDTISFNGYIKKEEKKKKKKS